MVINKVYNHRLFTVLYPRLETGQVSLLMKLCSSVKCLEFLKNQGKLEELIPSAREAFKNDDSV